MGGIDLEALERQVDEETAALMLTNPSTLGVFENEIHKIADILHAKGALLYMDGANMNALVGKVRPGDFGVDVMHLNLHKTFSTPHGGGGPGSGPVACKAFLEPFLPIPVLVRSRSADAAPEAGRPRMTIRAPGDSAHVPRPDAPATFDGCWRARTGRCAGIMTGRSRWGGCARSMATRACLSARWRTFWPTGRMGCGRRPKTRC